MENSKQPAYPLSKERAEKYTDDPNHATGLTKRELIAAMAMQGIISNAPNGQLHNAKQGVELATLWADELLNQLENK